MKYRLFFALQVVLLAMMGFWGPAHAQLPQQLTTHDANQTSQHNSLSGQVTTHDAAQTAHDAAQTNQHNGLSGQVITHDSAQTSQHNELKGKIDNLGDHSGLPPTWDKILPADDPGGPSPATSSRFTCVMGGAAVRDNETGLVWERLPLPNTGTITWSEAQSHCNTLTLGNRKGWRQPTLQELASLVDGDPANTSSPRLPAGHPFSNVHSAGYWSATTSVAALTSSAWFVNFFGGDPSFDSKSNANFAWCVRGGQGVDPQ